MLFYRISHSGAYSTFPKDSFRFLKDKKHG